MRQLFLIVPIGILGLVRWASWLIRRLPAVLYKPYESDHAEPLTVVTPVYQEDPEIFRAAVESWLANDHVAEVIAVVDETDEACIDIANSLPITVLVTDVPGKRDALRRGWELAKTDIVALVDSDTIWATDVAARVLEPFADPQIGGVSPRQNVLNPSSLWQRLNDFYLDYRYFDEVAGQSKWGTAVSCLSGRTAVYRRDVLLEISDEFMSETFWGVPCNSGEDKRLTMLTLRQGYKTYLQQNARVWSTFPAGGKTFFLQRLRWARNTWRSDLRALREGWVFRHKWLAFSMIDKAISAFTLLVAPIFMIVALVTRHWGIAGFLGLWWLVSRGLKYLPHLERRPADVFLLPAFILSSFLAALMKIYALLTVRKQKWLTRDVEVVGGKLVRTGNSGSGAGKPAAGMARTRLSAGTLFGGLVGILAMLGISAGLADAQLSSRSSSTPNPSASVVPSEAAAVTSLDELALSAAAPLQAVGAGTCLDPSEPPVREAGNELYNGTSSSRQLQAYAPFRISQVSCSFPADYRAMTLSRDKVVLQAGGEVVSEVALSGGQNLTLTALAEAIADDSWLEASSDGVVTLKAALIQSAGSSLVVAAPDVTELRLVDEPHVFLGGKAATVRFDGVTVTSWSRDGSGVDENYRDGRPFVLYTEGSKFDISNSTFTYLGSDRSGAYGISWRLDSSGTVQDSIFTKNFFGQFSYEADGLTYRRNDFSENVFYGVDPHDRSRNLLFEDNTFTNNGSHGAIVSREVYDSVFRNNVSTGNGGNGFVIDSGSFNVTIQQNEVRDNGGDGIVILASQDNVIADNTVTGNRVGIRVNAEGSDGNVLRGNIIENNSKGVEAYGGAGAVRIEGGNVSNSSVAGLTLDAPGSTLSGVTINGSPIGLELRAPATATGTVVSDVATGVVVKSPDPVTLSGLDIKASDIGVRVDRRSEATLTNASIEAPNPYKGSEFIVRGADVSIKTLAPPGLHWFGVAGFAFLVAALLLEAVRRTRMRGFTNRGEAPEIVINPT